MVRFDALKSALINDVPESVPENVPEKLTGIKLRIYELIKANPCVSRPHLAAQCGKSVKTIGRYLAEMKNLIQHTGPAKGGRWIILSSSNSKK